MKSFNKINLAVITAIAGLATSSAFADSYDASSAFLNAYNTPASASAQAFTFGYYDAPGSSLSSFDETQSIDGLDFLQSKEVQNSLVPAVFYNPSANPITYGSLTLDSDQLAFHPGESTDSVIRFTAPRAGDYSFTAGFEGADTTSTKLMVVENGATNLGSGSVTGYHDITFSYDKTITLAKGDYIDFAVNNDGNFNNDSTAVIGNLTVTSPSSTNPTPLPASAEVGFSMLAGFGALAVGRKHLKLSRRLQIA